MPRTASLRADGVAAYGDELERLDARVGDRPHVHAKALAAHLGAAGDELAADQGGE
jgi:hypothetical protein